MRIATIQQFWLWLSLTLAAILLTRFAIDFTNEMPLLLAIPFDGLVLATLAIAFWNIIRFNSSQPLSSVNSLTGNFLLAAIPLGFWASSLDCSGLSLSGCTPFCTFIKIGWIPLMAAVVIASHFFKNEWLLFGVGLLSWLTLVPHCLCFNPGNGWWIDRIGASPMCYIWGFVVTLISLSALKSKAPIWLSLLINSAILLGAFGFFIAHHYFHFPW
ncbi:MAG: hypothetical protein AB1757_24615 [Acidobacteriota bacterium]